ncbi:MAG: hypothetical protein R3B09_08265 [Nannocystaceae bacterium]
MRIRLVVTLASLVALAAPAIARADLPPPEDQQVCRSKKLHEACKVDGKAGACVSHTCHRRAYRNGEFSMESYSCLRCEAGKKPTKGKDEPTEEPTTEVTPPAITRPPPTPDAPEVPTLPPDPSQPVPEAPKTIEAPEAPEAPPAPPTAPTPPEPTPPVEATPAPPPAEPAKSGMCSIDGAAGLGGPALLVLAALGRRRRR